MTDFIFMVHETSHMFITGPDVVKTVTGEDVTLEQLGGAMSHATRSGVATFVAPNEKACLDEVRYLLSFLPSNNLEAPPDLEEPDDLDAQVIELRDMVPDSPNQPYDMRRVITAVVDGGEYLEYFPRWAMNLTCGFARIGGRAVGIVGNEPSVLAGVLDISSSEKGARFVRTCDAFNIPLVTFVDVPGFMPGTDQEYGGIIRHGAKLLYAYCEATVPRVQVIIRKAYGGAYIVMDSEVHRGRLRLRMAVGRACRHGATGCGRDRLPARARGLAGPRRPSCRARRRLHRALRESLRRGRARIRRRRDRPGRHRPRPDPRPSAAASKREELPKRKHGNVPL